MLELFVELRAKGFVRVRVDGKVLRDRRRRRSSRRRRSTPIEVVVDRLQVSSRIQAAARRIVRDRAARRRRPRDRGRDGRRQGSGEEHLFSAEVRVPDLQLLAAGARAAPLLVQQPDGRVPALRRPRRRSASSIRSASSRFRSMRLASGAIKGWDRRNQFYFQMLQSLGEACTASTSSEPFAKLPERDAADAILYGSGDEKIAFTYLSASAAGRRVREHAFEGIIPNLERRYRETDSMMVREELAKYLNNKPCPECDGTRLQREARHVKVGPPETQRDDLRGVAMAAEGNAGVLRRAVARPARRRQIADKIVKEIVSRAAVPEQRRPRLSVARPLGRNAVRRRGAADPARVADRLRASPA